MAPLDPDPLRVTRHPERQATERAALHDVLDAGVVAHVGVVRDGAAVVLPMGYARDGDALLLHGSTGGGMLRAAAGGTPVTVTVTLLDGLVYARSMFDSSMNYRSAMVVGTAVPLEGGEKLEGLRRLSEHLMPGRWDETRPPAPKELAATVVLRLPLERASVKVRAAGPSTAPDDGESREVWAGVVPLGLHAGAPVPAPDVPVTVAAPASTARARERHPGAA